MIFLGYESALGDSGMQSTTPSTINNINSITLKNGIYDNFYVAKDDNVIDIESNTWNLDTVMNAGFNGNLSAGNLEYSVSQISLLRLKRREIGKLEWITLSEYPVSGLEDLSHEWIDRYVQSKTKYDWAIVPVINGVEGRYNIGTGEARFEGIVILDKDNTYLTKIEPQVDVTRNHPSSAINTLDGRYPVVVYNSQNNYNSGTASGWFMRYDPQMREYDGEFGWKYRDGLMDFLSDCKPKFLKLGDGRAWLVNIVENPTESSGEHEYKRGDFMAAEIWLQDPSDGLNFRAKEIWLQDPFDGLNLRAKEIWLQDPSDGLNARVFAAGIGYTSITDDDWTGTSSISQRTTLNSNGAFSFSSGLDAGDGDATIWHDLIIRFEKPIYILRNETLISGAINCDGYRTSSRTVTLNYQTPNSNSWSSLDDSIISASESGTVNNLNLRAANISSQTTISAIRIRFRALLNTSSTNESWFSANSNGLYFLGQIILPAGYLEIEREVM